MAAAANSITAANSPARLKITSERQYWARLMRPLGAEQKLEQRFHDRATYESTAEPAFGNVSL